MVRVATWLGHVIACLSSAQLCAIQAPVTLLSSDTVDWSIQVASGQNCVRGLRFGDVLVEKVSLTSPSKSGNVQLEGPETSAHTPNAGFPADTELPHCRSPRLG